MLTDGTVNKHDKVAHTSINEALVCNFVRGDHSDGAMQANRLLSAQKWPQTKHTSMQEALLDGLFESLHKVAVQAGMGQALFHVLDCCPALWVVHHYVEHLTNAQLPHCLIYIVVKPPLPLLQAAALYCKQTCCHQFALVYLVTIAPILLNAILVRHRTGTAACEQI